MLPAVQNCIGLRRDYCLTCPTFLRCGGDARADRGVKYGLLHPGRMTALPLESPHLDVPPLALLSSDLRPQVARPSRQRQLLTLSAFGRSC
jgi:hypothetical protein